MDDWSEAIMVAIGVTGSDKECPTNPPVKKRIQSKPFKMFDT